METDKITLNDLSVFHHEEEFSIFHKLDFTRTVGGSEKLKNIFTRSFTDLPSIQNVQKTLQILIEKQDSWPLFISNGSVMMIQKFYESSVDQIPSMPTASSAYLYKIFHAPDFSLVKYSTGHAFDFLKGMNQIIEHFLNDDAPANLKLILEKAKVRLEKPQLHILSKKKSSDLSIAEMLRLANFLRYHFKQNFIELTDIYSQLDAWNKYL